MAETGALTPMMEQYEGVKARYPGHLVLFRVGDFYETYGEDARLLSRELEVVLTARAPDSRGARLPMAGVPYHAVESYLGRLIRRGYKVALCDQVEDPRSAKGLVRREVTRIVTPGTILDERILPGADHNFLAVALAIESGPAAFAVVDITTGELFSGSAPHPEPEGLCEALAPFEPREILLAGSVALEPFELALRRSYPRARLENAPAPLPAAELPNGFRGSEADSAAEREARGRLAAYLQSTQPRVLPFVELIRWGGIGTRLRLDAKSLRHLEISRPMSPDEPGSPTLIDVLDETVTASGHRTLAFWLRNPLAQPAAIAERQDLVEAIRSRGAHLLRLREELKAIPDLARIGARIVGRRVRPTELLSLARGLRAVQRVRQWIAEDPGFPAAGAWARRLEALTAQCDRLEGAVSDPAPASVEAGGLFRPGFDAELDGCRAAESGALGELGALEQRERDRSGIRALRLGYNQVFGYYLELPRAAAPRAPAHFERRQTLAGTERYTTAELRSIEERTLTAREALRVRELALWESLLAGWDQLLPELYRVSRAVGEIDVLATFALQAQERGYVRPVVDESRGIQIREGRHPILERLLGREFVPNDADLDAESSRLLLLTGPNMSGKSTYMRQLGLLVVLAQVGSFVPARFARVGCVSSLFTRMGFTDAIGRGKSSFLVEMSEVAEILREADDRSLVLLDEVGRGTSTFDGLAIAWATLRYLHDRVRCRAAVATHYHQLTELVAGLPAARNAHLAVREDGKEVVFLRTLVPGSTDRSLGLHVARLAGVPDEVLRESGQLLRQWEREGRALPTRASRGPPHGPRYTQAVLLPSGAGTDPSPVEDALRALDLDRLSPLEAHSWLVEWRRRLQAPEREESDP